MWRAIWLFIIFAGLFFVVSWVSEQSGDVTLYWLGHRIDSSVSVLLGGIILASVVTALFYRFFLAIRRAPKNLKKYMGERQRKKGYVALTRGMVAVAAGDAEEASRQVRRADGLLGDPALTLLLSAQTAQLSGDTQAAQTFFTEMLNRPETEFLGLRGQLNQAMKSGNRDEALRLAHRANNLKPKSEWVASNLFDLEVREKRWAEALNTLAASVKNKLVADKDARRHRSALEHLMGLQAAAIGSTQKALRHARKSHDLDPTFSPGTAHYADLLLSAGQKRKATGVIEKSWRHGPHPDLLELYLIARDTMTVNERLIATQRLAKVNPHHTESDTAIASIALEAQIWGEAGKHLERILKKKPTASTYRLMADLVELADGNAKESRDWLRRATEADPDAAWVCDLCNHVHLAWVETCGKCENFNSLTWEIPPHAIAQELIPRETDTSMFDESISELLPPS